MEWKYVKKLHRDTLVDDFETYIGVTLPPTYKKCVLLNNGGKPERKCFYTPSGQERCIKTLLSFDPTDRENIWAAWQNREKGSLPFAIDNFGNEIAFLPKNQTNPFSVVFINHETGKREHIADTFSTFMDKLY